VNTQNYLVVLPPANPTYSPAPGTYTSPVSVTINESTPGAQVYYSLNGGAWTQYTGPVALPAHTTSNLQMVGYVSDGVDYAVSTNVKGTYIVN
jgi:hypothetical protein